MRVNLRKANIELKAPEPSPVLRVQHSDIEGRSSFEIAQIEVENSAGEFSRFWVEVQIKNGRPQLVVTTKTGANLQKQIEKKIQGTFNLI